uniref:ComF family protein n=1 Tax=Desertifilum tharense IPPAS B-1220 TaxID=1781255 RepID=A0ACD5GRI1_9CYAN
MAERFCEISGLRLYSSGLKRVRQTQAQFGLSSSARSLNLTEAFVVGNLKRNSPILLLDDIYTTGATARSAAQTLQQQGISVLGIGAIALAGQS